MCGGDFKGIRWKGRRQETKGKQLTQPAYRASHATRLPPPYTPNPRQIYHALHPHPALSPVPSPIDPASCAAQAENEDAYRELLARRALQVLLSPPERDNAALMALVGAIIADLVLGKVAERACEPGFIWESVAKVVEGVRKKDGKRRSGDDAEARRNGGWQATFWMVLQSAFLVFSVGRALVVAVATSSSLPRRGGGDSKSTTHTPVVAMKMWGFLAKLIELEVRMPWVYGALALLQWGMLYGPGKVGAVDGMLDKYVAIYPFSFFISRCQPS